MKIDGKAIAQNILSSLKNRVTALKTKGIIPHLAIILVGEDPASETYVRQKTLKGNEIGAKVTVKLLPPSVTQEELLQLLNDLNHLTFVHGLIVQRPLPHHLDTDAIDKAVDPKKDVDGFHPQTKFKMPLAAAVLKILEETYKLETRNSKLETVSDFGFRISDFHSWLTAKKVVIIGKGKTGGAPVISALAKLGVEPLIIDSKTQNPDELTKSANIIISAVGKPNTIRPNAIRKRVILISIGIYRSNDGKLHGDYEEDGIKDIVSFYTPTPGGVGPVNVAMLLENVVKAAENITNWKIPLHMLKYNPGINPPHRRDEAGIFYAWIR